MIWLIPLFIGILLVVRGNARPPKGGWFGDMFPNAEQVYGVLVLLTTAFVGFGYWLNWVLH